MVARGTWRLSIVLSEPALPLQLKSERKRGAESQQEGLPDEGGKKSTPEHAQLPVSGGGLSSGLSWDPYAIAVNHNGEKRPRSDEEVEGAARTTTARRSRARTTPAPLRYEGSAVEEPEFVEAGTSEFVEARTHRKPSASHDYLAQELLLLMGPWPHMLPGEEALGAQPQEHEEGILGRCGHEGPAPDVAYPAYSANGLIDFDAFFDMRADDVDKMMLIGHAALNTKVVEC